MDCIDLHIPVNSIDNRQLWQAEEDQPGELNKDIRQRVCAARSVQLARQGVVNSRLDTQQFKTVCPLDQQQQAFMDRAINSYKLSTRSFHRLLKVARSIADLAGLEVPDIPQYQEALSYRCSFKTLAT